MNIIAKQCMKTPAWCRAFSNTTALSTYEWRSVRGLPLNRNAEGVLTDGPDYTFLDGRPTPLLHKQKRRIIKQREYAEKIVEMCAELDFAQERHKKLQLDKEEERQKILNNRLKPKGNNLYKTK